MKEVIEMKRFLAVAAALFAFEAADAAGGVLFAASTPEAAVPVATSSLSISCDYPGGNVKVLGIDEKNGVVRIAPDVHGNRRKYFHFDFTVRGAAGRTLHFQFPEDKYQYLAALGPAISRDGGKNWSWLRPDGTYHDPADAFDYTFGKDEDETRFAFSIPYTQKDWDEYSARWRGAEGVEFGVLCKSQCGRRDTELLRVPCRGEAKWLFAFTSRHHACETSASAVMEGVIDELLSGSPEGEWVRNNADCVFVPFMDKDGVEEGEQGKHRAPHDYNRDYNEGLYAAVRAFKELIERESKGRQIVFLDMHAPHSRATGSRRPSIHDTVFMFEPFGFPRQAERWQELRRNWAETSKGGALVYTGKTDVLSGMKGNDKRETLQSRNWVKEAPNCWMATCCEFGYSLCGGVYSRPAARELGRSLMKAAARTVQNAAGAEAVSNDSDILPDGGQFPFWEDSTVYAKAWHVDAKRGDDQSGDVVQREYRRKPANGWRAMSLPTARRTPIGLPWVSSFSRAQAMSRRSGSCRLASGRQRCMQRSIRHCVRKAAPSRRTTCG